MRLKLLRNATLRISYAGQEILVDPCLGAKGSLPSFAGIAPNPTVELSESVPAIVDGIDLAIISHLHIDHFDVAGEDALPKELSMFCQPEDLETIKGKGFTQVTALTNETTWNGISLQRTAGQHGTGEVLKKAGLVMGFILRAPGEPTFYWAGDTVLIPKVLDIIANERPDVILTHSGGAIIDDTFLIMNDSQTVELIRNASGAKVIAVHLEAIDHCSVTRAKLRATANAAGISEAQLFIPADGQELNL
jgi:L-ascorbate metabolism protein UlaG (beta-lactamase superfamily)